MKKIILLLIILTINGCVSSTEHEKTLNELKELKANYEKLETENDNLKKEIEELKFGIPNLTAEIKKLYSLKEYKATKDKIDLLIQKHPTAPETYEAKKLLPIIEENLLWDLVKKSNDISLAKNYINKYPKGKHIYKVKKIYKKLKKQKEKEDYAEAKRINTSDVWQKFLNNYPNHWDRKNIKKRIISLKVDEIMQSNETGNLPSFSKTNYGHSAISTVTIHNDTGYELTVRYSGPSIKEIVIPKGKYKTTRLKSGSYKIAASAGGLNYAGTEDLSGNYTSKYYIVTTRY